MLVECCEPLLYWFLSIMDVISPWLSELAFLCSCCLLGPVFYDDCCKREFFSRMAELCLVVIRPGTTALDLSAAFWKVIEASLSLCARGERIGEKFKSTWFPSGSMPSTFLTMAALIIFLVSSLLRLEESGRDPLSF